MGMEILAFSSSTPKESFHTRDDYVNGVTVEDLKVNCKRKYYDEDKNFENLIQEQAENIGSPYPSEHVEKNSWDVLKMYVEKHNITYA